MPTDKTLEEIMEEFDRDIMVGIGSCEVDDEDGWWETDTGAEFGREQRKKVAEFVRQAYLSGLERAAEVLPGYKSEAHDPDESYMVNCMKSSEAKSFNAAIDESRSAIRAEIGRNDPKS